MMIDGREIEVEPGQRILDLLAGALPALCDDPRVAPAGACRLCLVEVRPLPKPVPFWFRFGEPIEAPANASAKDVGAVLDIHRRVWARTQRMVDALVYEWEDAQRKGRQAA